MGGTVLISSCDADGYDTSSFSLLWNFGGTLENEAVPAWGLSLIPCWEIRATEGASWYEAGAGLIFLLLC
jgi:hypothetical protein